MKTLASAALALALLASPASAQEITQGLPSNIPMRFGGPATVSVNPGAIALGAKRVTVSVPGVRVGDFVMVVPHATTPITVGAVMNGMAEVQSNGQVTITFVTPIALGVTIGSFSVRVFWIGGGS